MFWLERCSGFHKAKANSFTNPVRYYTRSNTRDKLGNGMEIDYKDSIIKV